MVENYRAAHAIAEKDKTDGRASTEELRQAMVHYRSLFEELLGEQEERAVPSEPNVGGSRPVVREEARTRRLDDAGERSNVTPTRPGATTNRGAGYAKL